MSTNKKCAKPDCGKTVYPMEELKCLDKVWHKGCFRCTVCNMALSMKNYKGFNKMPYCEPHYPKTVATVTNDTPEMRRLNENTKNQSLVQYHAEFEKMKGQKTDISIDDPEMQRNLKNMQVFSQAAYHHDTDRKAEMERIRPPLEQNSRDISNGGGYQTPNGGMTTGSAYIGGNRQGHIIYNSDQGAVSGSKAVGKIDDYDPLNGQWGSGAKTQQHSQQSGDAVSPVQAPGQARAEALHVSRQHPSQLSPRAQHEHIARQMNTSRQYLQNAYGGGATTPKQPPAGPSFRAMYDYTAADVDEVTFVEGDVIVNTKSVDEGWMTGTVQRTSQWGMLPANYVERVN